MGSIPLPALDVKPPQTDPLEQYGRLLQLKNLLNQQSLFPVQQQEAQTQLQSTQADLQLKQIQVRDQSIWQDAMKQAASEGAASGAPEQPGSIFQRAGDIATKNGASFNSILAHNTALADLQQKLAATSKDQLANLETQHANLRSELEAVLAQPENQQEAEYNTRVETMRANPAASQQAYGVDPTKLPPYPGKAQLQTQADMLAGFHNLVQEHTAATSAAGSEARGKAALTEAQLNQEKLDIEKSGGLPVSLTDKYNQQQANYRASLARTVTMANDLQKAGLSKLDQMFTDPVHGYTQFLAQADATKAAVQQAKDGSELQASLTPLMTALGVVSYANIHRINQYDINTAGPTVGSYYRQLNTLLDKAGTGKLEPATAQETVQLMDNLIDAKHQSLVQGASMIVKNAGLDPAKTVVMGRDGDVSPLSKEAAPKLQSADPTKDVYKLGDKYYHYKGTGDTTDLKNFTEVAPPAQ